MAYACHMSNQSGSPMKRSRRTSLVLMGAAPLLLVACSQEPEVQTAEGLFTSVEACVDKTQNPYMCKQAFDQAQMQAAEAAPKFASMQDCEAQFGQGQCGTQQAGGHSFIGPLMTGFFLSQMLSGRNAGLAPAGGPPPVGTTKGEPAFRSASNEWLKPGPSSAGGAATALTRVDAQPDRAMTVRRGGFGATSARRSGGFGG